MTTRQRSGTKRKRAATSRKSRSQTSSAAFLRNTHRAVRSTLAAAEDLPVFLASAGTLTLPERRLLVDQALVLLEGNYVHLPLKESMHAVDPVQALRLLRHRLENQAASTMGAEWRFHAEMLRIFASVRDLHTNYLLPPPFSQRTAFLPFHIEEYHDDGSARYLVSHIVDGFVDPEFVAGVEVTSWSGVPIERAVEVNADRFAGSNPAARHARGVQFLTVRPMISSLPPDEAWVEVGFIDQAGEPRTLRHDWLVFEPGSGSTGVDANAVTPAAASLGVDVELDAATEAKRMLFAPATVAAAAKQPKLTTRPADVGSDVPTVLPEVLRARSIPTASGDFGHLRIFTFNVDDPDGFLDEIERVLDLLPPEGLIIDVRGNGGGHIYASEGLLQLLTPQPITPEPTQFVATPLNLRLCRRHRANPLGIDLGPWFASLDQATETGATYSTAHPITPTDFANRRGQRYRGPVVCITDARCYSATDIFAAGFQDHAIGPVLGVDANTGAGGANVWTHSLLRELLRQPAPVDPSSPYASLPKGANMRVAIRRTLRVHDRAGTPLEDLGVEPDERWTLTRDDLLSGNADLMNRAGELLAGMDRYTLDARVLPSDDDGQPIEVTTGNFGRLDVFVDDRPYASRNVSQGTSTIVVPPSASAVRLDGRSGTRLVVSRTIPLR